MARFAALFALLVPLAAGGCLAPYCYPKLEHIPSIREESEADVHVFRVDVTRYPVKFLLFLTQTQQDQLRELSADDNHAVPAQTQLSMSRGLGLIGVLLRDDGTHVRHDLRLKLYRPGYELIVLEPGKPTANSRHWRNIWVKKLKRCANWRGSKRRSSCCYLAPAASPSPNRLGPTALPRRRRRSMIDVGSPTEVGR